MLVVLGAGSHARQGSSGFPQIYPHTPVHLAEDFNTLTAPGYNLLLSDAADSWNDAVGSTVITFTGQLDGQEIDSLFIDLAEDAFKQITYNNHNGQTPSFGYTFLCSGGCPAYAHVPRIPATHSLGLGFKLVIANATAGLIAVSDDANVLRTFEHEFGHILSLRDHDNTANPGPYSGMMDGTCALNACDDPADYEILNFTSELFPNFPILKDWPDEASCVRELFDIAGKQLCEDIT